MLRLGPGGVEATLTEGEIKDEAATDNLLGLVQEAVPTGFADVVLTGLPNNPPGALVYQIKEVLGLVRTPLMFMMGEGKAMLSVQGHAADLKKLKAGGAAGFSVFQTTVTEA